MTTTTGRAAPISWAQAGPPVPVRWVIAGPATQVMLSVDGHRVWIGTGPPSVVVGATLGDLYLDSDTGFLYRLD